MHCDAQQYERTASISEAAGRAVASSAAPVSSRAGPPRVTVWPLALLCVMSIDVSDAIVRMVTTSAAVHAACEHSAQQQHTEQRRDGQGRDRPGAAAANRQIRR